MIPNSRYRSIYRVDKYTVDKDDLIYMYKSLGYYPNLKQEIRTFHYQNDKLVDAGIKWKDLIDGITSDVKCICIV